MKLRCLVRSAVAACAVAPPVTIQCHGYQKSCRPRACSKTPTLRILRTTTPACRFSTTHVSSSPPERRLAAGALVQAEGGVQQDELAASIRPRQGHRRLQVCVCMCTWIRVRIYVSLRVFTRTCIPCSVRRLCSYCVHIARHEAIEYREHSTAFISSHPCPGAFVNPPQLSTP